MENDTTKEEFWGNGKIKCRWTENKNGKEEGLYERWHELLEEM